MVIHSCCVYNVFTMYSNKGVLGVCLKKIRIVPCLHKIFEKHLIANFEDLYASLWQILQCMDINIYEVLFNFFICLCSNMIFKHQISICKSQVSILYLTFRVGKFCLRTNLLFVIYCQYQGNKSSWRNFEFHEYFYWVFLCTHGDVCTRPKSLTTL